MDITLPHIKIGIDEAGRGPWYGPVVACALAFDPLHPPSSDFIETIGDSKKCSEKKRSHIFHEIITFSESEQIYFGVGVVDNDYIDTYGIKKATQEAMRRAITEILRSIPKTYVIHSTLIDGNDGFDFWALLPKSPISIIRWDSKVKEIWAASIVAKVFRDKLMDTYSLLHPTLGIDSHKGYGTKKHSENLDARHITSFHRISYKPIENILKNKKPKVLLHVCCGPDATVPIMDLKKDYEVIGYWYDPNIQPKAEYEKRRDAFAQVCEIEGIEWMEWPYDVKHFFEVIKWLEDTPEQWEKCTKCYDMRLAKSAEIAQELGVDFYTSTLNTSPHKDLDKMFSLGEKYGNIHHIPFLKIPFRKNGGFNRSVEYTKKHDIYRQDYCGCVYSDTFPGRVIKAKDGLKKKRGWSG